MFVHVCVLFMATMLLCGSCQLRSMYMCSLCMCLCVCSLYGDHAFVRVMSTEKYVCVCLSLYGDLAFVRVMSTEMCVCVCVSLYGNHAFVRVMSTEKYLHVYSMCVCVCVFLFTVVMLCACHDDWEVSV